MDGRPHYAIAGTWTEFRQWLKDRSGPEIHYLTERRAELYLRWGMPKGVLHRIGTWEQSPAREAAERMEG